MYEEPEFFKTLISHFLSSYGKQRRTGQYPKKPNALYRIIKEHEILSFNKAQSSMLNYIMFTYVLNHKNEKTFEAIDHNMKIDLGHHKVIHAIPSNRDYRSALKYFVDKGLVAKGPVYRSTIYYVNPFVLNNLSFAQNEIAGFS